MANHTWTILWKWEILICLAKQQRSAVLSICGLGRLCFTHMHTTCMHTDTHTRLPSFSCWHSIVLVNVGGAIQARKSIHYVSWHKTLVVCKPSNVKMTSHGDCITLAMVCEACFWHLWFTSYLVSNSESAVCMVTEEPSHGSIETWLLCTLPPVLFSVILMLCFFVDDVNTCLHYPSPGWPVLGKLMPVQFKATLHQVMPESIIPLWATHWLGFLRRGTFQQLLR